MSATRVVARSPQQIYNMSARQRCPRSDDSIMRIRAILKLELKQGIEHPVAVALVKVKDNAATLLLKIVLASLLAAIAAVKRCPVDMPAVTQREFGPRLGAGHRTASHGRDMAKALSKPRLNLHLVCTYPLMWQT